MHVTAASFRLKYAIASFLVVLLAAAAVAVLFMVRHAADARSLTALAEQAARERLAPELEARARTIAARGADAIAGAVRAGDADGIARKLQPFTDDATLAAVTVTGSGGRTLYSWHREAAAAPGSLTTAASARVTTLAENIPDREEQRAFLKKMSLVNRKLASATSTTAKTQPEAPATIAPRPAFTPDVLATAEKRLASYVGPLARVLIKQAAESSGNLKELYAQLATHIDSEEERTAFLESLR